MLLERFISWKSKEATSEAVKQVQYSHSSASIHRRGGTGKSHLIAHVCVRVNTEESYCVRVCEKGTFSDASQMKGIITVTVIRLYCVCKYCFALL